MDNHSPIGVLDSGVGGLTVLKVLHSLMPYENFIYLGDTANAPFGVRSEEENRALISKMLDFMQAQDVKQVVIACNTLTMLDVNTLQPGRPFHIIGVSHAVELLRKYNKNKRIGIMATPYTINSGVHKKEIHSYDPEIEVYGQACPKLVPLIEAEQFDTEEMALAIKEYTDPLKKAGVDIVILSCTHFPFVKNKIENALGANIMVLDPAGRTATNAHIQLHKREMASHSGGGKLTVCFTSNLARAKSLAQRMLPITKCEFRLIDLKNY